MKTARTVITIVLLFTAVSLFAQIENKTLMKVDIPFAFSVGEKSLPAGQYAITAVTAERNIGLMSADGKHSLVVQAMPNYMDKLSPNSRLVFNKYGNQYFLEQVWTARKDVVRCPLSSKREIEIARSGSKPETEVILAYAGR